MSSGKSLFKLGDNFPTHNPELEREMVVKGVNRQQAKISAARGRESETETNYGQVLLKNAIPALVTGLEDWRIQQSKAPVASNVYFILNDLDDKVVSFIALKSILDCVTQKRTLASSAIRVGALIEDEMRYKSFSKHPNWEGILKGAKRRPSYKKKRYYLNVSHKGEASKNNIEEWIPWTTRIKLHIGTVLIELVRQRTGLVDYVLLQADKKGPSRYITPTSKTIEWIEEMIKRTESLFPFWMPLQDFPKQWTPESKWSGGYSTENGLPALPFIKTRNKAFIRENQEPMTEVMSAVNALQNTSWKINLPVLESLRRFWDEGIELGGLPEKEDIEIPPFPKDSEDVLEKRNWKRRAATIYEHNASTKSRRLLVLNTLALANKYSNRHFYLPNQCDFRGRVYTVPPYLSHMGTSFQKGLMEFASTKPINNEDEARWLFIHGAQQRIDWVSDNRNEIKKTADDCFKNLDFLQQADDPVTFLAFCYELKSFMKEGFGFQSSLPCQMDGSTNGLQLLGILMRDESSCVATNVAPSNYPQDLYGIVSDRTIKYLKEDKESPFADSWLAYGVDRKTTKRPTMTQPYGSTQYSCRQYVADWYKEKSYNDKNKPFAEDTQYQATAYLANYVWRSIHDIVGKPQEAMAWLQETAKTLAQNNKPFYWVSPSGFPCYQYYHKWENKAIKSKIGDKVMRVRFRNEIDAPSKARMAQGSSPNYIHSIDAAIMHKLVNRMHSKDVKSFAMVHDSFGTHSSRCPEMAKEIREVFVETFTPDLLQELKDTIEERDGVNLTPLPTKGDFNINQIIKSEYIFG